MHNFYNVAATYLDFGWLPIPLQRKDKKPFDGYKWKDARLTLETARNFPTDCNIGVSLGKNSNGLVDLDFDCSEAGIIANKLFSHLPGFGRQSAPFGHKILYCPDAGKTQQFKLTPEQAEIAGFTEKSVVMELRANGGYTMFPPSVHPSGEIVQWHNGLPENIPEMKSGELQKSCGLCAFLAVILKKYPTGQGARDEICMALTGTLLRAKLPPNQVDDWIVFIAEQKGDNEAQKRKKADTTKEKMDAREEVTGLPKLCELLGITELKDILSKWLYGTNQPEKPDECEKEILELNKRFFVVRNEGGKCLVGSFESHPLGKGLFRDMLVFQSPADWKNWFANHQVIVDYKDGIPIFKPLGKVWWEHPKRRQYERVVFMPEQEVPDDQLNLWRGYGVQPKKGSWRRMQRHIWRVLAKSDLEAFRFIIKWCAWTVQNPGEPAEVALVFRGGKGTGKGTFCNALVTIFGHHGHAISSSLHLTGRFNAHMRDCVLLFADEAIAPNDKKAESVLKALITEPRLMIEGKNKDSIPHPNHLHIVMASNDSWVVPASSDERRYAVFDVSDTLAQKADWFGPLYYELENGGLSAMLHFFKNLDLGNWHPRKNIPVNDALREQQAQSLTGFDRIWFDWLCEAEAQGIGRSDGRVFISTSLFAKIAGGSVRAAGLYLERLGCEKDRSSGHGRGYITPPLIDARKIWDQTYFNGSWNDSDIWESCEPDIPF